MKLTLSRITFNVILFSKILDQATRNPQSSGECHGQADHVRKYYYYIMVTENTKYALRVADPWAADRTAGDWFPKGRIFMTS